MRPEDAALEYQRQFLDHFWTGAHNGMLQRPRVQLEVRKNIDEYSVREEAAWPLAHTDYRELYLSAPDRALVASQPAVSGSVTYDTSAGERVSFGYRFDAACEITGRMRLRLWVSTDRGDDMDLFVAVNKLDRAGEEVPFEGRENDTRGPISNGWPRVSHRALDPLRSRRFQPVLTHDKVQLIEPGKARIPCTSAAPTPPACSSRSCARRASANTSISNNSTSN